jgi:hypothetical protein
MAHSPIATRYKGRNTSLDGWCWFMIKTTAWGGLKLTPEANREPTIA